MRTNLNICPLNMKKIIYVANLKNFRKLPKTDHFLIFKCKKWSKEHIIYTLLVLCTLYL